MDLVKLRNRSGSDLEVAFLQGREVKSGGEVEVAGRVITDPAEAALIHGGEVELAADAVHIAHPTADGEQLLAWPLAVWEPVSKTPAVKPAKDKE